MSIKYGQNVIMISRKRKGIGTEERRRRSEGMTEEKGETKRQKEHGTMKDEG